MTSRICHLPSWLKEQNWSSILSFFNYLFRGLHKCKALKGRKFIESRNQGWNKKVLGGKFSKNWLTGDVYKSIKLRKINWDSIQIFHCCIPYCCILKSKQALYYRPLRKLKRGCGISGNILRRIESFLTDRKQPKLADQKVKTYFNRMGQKTHRHFWR